MFIHRLFPSLITALALSSTALAIVPSSGRVALFGPAAFDGEASGADDRLLPRGVVGLLPERDGAPFALEVEAGVYSGRDTREIRAALADILPAVGFAGDVEALEISDAVVLASPDAREVAAQASLESEALLRALEARLGALSEVTERAVAVQAEENVAQMLAERAVYRVEQRVDRLPVRSLGLSVRVDGDGSIIGITGALTDVDRLAGEVRFDAEKAEAIAKDHIGASEEVTEVGAAEALAIGSEGALRPAWSVEVTTSGRWFKVSVDAETGEVIGVTDETMAFASGEGRAFTPSPFGSTYVSGLEVNDAVGGKFVLANDDIATVTTFGGDGCSTSPVSVSSGGGYADFDVSPINSTNVNDATDPNYNCRFQEVNAFLRVLDTLYWYEGLGAEASPPVPVRVNVGDACGDGADQACAGGGMLTMGIGSATLSGGTSGLFNTALDQTVITHELGHHVYSRQTKVGGGTGNSSLSEGLADYFAMAEQNLNTVADYTGANTGMYVQWGGLPRQAEARDVFPDHFDLGGNEAHANGQMVAWSQWSFRAEMADRSALGAGLATRMLLSALTCHGYGVTNDLGTEAEVYGAFQSLLACEVLEAGYSPSRVDVLQGWARAGVFTTANEAVIDISDDYLSSSDGPPTFTVWPGEDFTFSAGDASDSANYLDNFEVELANDPDFTVNVVSSGPKTGFGEVLGNTIATWTPSASDWATVKGGSLLYYRVKTWNDAGTKQRDSEHTFGGFAQVPTAVAVINGGGSAGCSAAGGRAGLGWLGALLGLAGLVRRRR